MAAASASLDREALSYHERHLEPASLEFSPSGARLHLEQQPAPADSSVDAQSAVWTAGVVLADVLQRWPRAFWERARVVELGAGCGTAGLMAARLGAANVTLTDLPPLLPLLRRNCEANGVARTTRVAPLEWGGDAAARFARDAGGPFDVILGADITPFVQTLDELAETISALATPTRDGRDGTLVLISHRHRGADFRFVRDAFARAFAIEPIVESDIGVYQFHVRPRPEGGDGDGDEAALRSAIGAASHGDIGGLKAMFGGRRAPSEGG